MDKASIMMGNRDVNEKKGGEIVSIPKADWRPTIKFDFTDLHAIPIQAGRVQINPNAHSVVFIDEVGHEA